jgi:hypothetical protein
MTQDVREQSDLEKSNKGERKREAMIFHDYPHYRLY